MWGWYTAKPTHPGHPGTRQRLPLPSRSVTFRRLGVFLIQMEHNDPPKKTCPPSFQKLGALKILEKKTFFAIFFPKETYFDALEQFRTVPHLHEARIQAHWEIVFFMKTIVSFGYEKYAKKVTLAVGNG